MNTERLLRLANHLEQVVAPHPGTFDLGSWKNECGTTYCAVGHACSIPELRAIGLRLSPSAEKGEFYPEFNGLEGWCAVEVVFDLTSKEAYDLFSSDSYLKGTKPTDVARRIRDLVAGVAS